MKPYKIIAVPALTYGGKTWVLSNGSLYMNKIQDKAEIKLLRSVMGVLLRKSSKQTILSFEENGETQIPWLKEVYKNLENY